jgi:hypothetical protein
LFILSDERRKEKGQKEKIEVNEREHTLHSFSFSADRQTYLPKRYMHGHVTDLYDQTETAHISTEIKIKMSKKYTK